MARGDETLNMLRHAICVDPSDLTARLAYADRCAELGYDLRADLIRRQINKEPLTWNLQRYVDHRNLLSEDGLNFIYLMPGHTTGRYQWDHAQNMLYCTTGIVYLEYRNGFASRLETTVDVLNGFFAKFIGILPLTELAFSPQEAPGRYGGQHWRHNWKHILDDLRESQGLPRLCQKEVIER